MQLVPQRAYTAEAAFPVANRNQSLPFHSPVPFGAQAYLGSKGLSETVPQATDVRKMVQWDP